MAGCASGQDEPNSALWSATWDRLRKQDGAVTFEVYSNIPNVYHPVYSKCVRNVTERVKKSVFTGKRSLSFTYDSLLCQVKVSVWKTASKLS